MALGSGAAPPPRPSVLRATRHDAFAIRFNAAVTAVRLVGERLVLSTPSGEVNADFVIIGTGFGIDTDQRPELAKLLGGIATWADEEGHRADPLGLLAFPALGEGMEFLPKHPGQQNWVSRICCMNQGALMSHGRIAGDVPAISIGANRVADHLVEKLFVDDWRQHLHGIEIFDRPELLGDEWAVELAV